MRSPRRLVRSLSVCTLSLILAAVALRSRASRAHEPLVPLAAGEKQLVCSSSPTPPGWVVVDRHTDFTKCGGGWCSQKFIQDTNGSPKGTRLSICAENGVPVGWALKDTQTNFVTCNCQPAGSPPSSNNILVIEKL